jgi:predicted ATPase
MGYALEYAATLRRWRREVSIFQKLVDALMSLVREQGFTRLLVGGMIKLGWALAERGAVEEGIGHIRQGLIAGRSQGTEVGQTHNLSILAEAYGKGGQADKGLSVLAEVLAAVHRTDEHLYEAELYRLKGEFLQQTVGGMQYVKEAEACFLQALAVARRQQAKLLELRTAMSLSQLWQRQGKRHAARQMLVEVYDWFTEGFDTADLKKAKVLLEELT